MLDKYGSLTYPPYVIKAVFFRFQSWHGAKAVCKNPPRTSRCRFEGSGELGLGRGEPPQQPRQPDLLGRPPDALTRATDVFGQGVPCLCGGAG